MSHISHITNMDNSPYFFLECLDQIRAHVVKEDPAMEQFYPRRKPQVKNVKIFLFASLQFVHSYVFFFFFFFFLFCFFN